MHDCNTASMSSLCDITASACEALQVITALSSAGIQVWGGFCVRVSHSICPCTRITSQIRGKSMQACRGESMGYAVRRSKQGEVMPAMLTATPNMVTSQYLLCTQVVIPVALRNGCFPHLLES